MSAAKRIPTRNFPVHNDEAPSEPAGGAPEEIKRQSDDDVDWRTVAQRLKADMEGFRLRQRRNSEQAVTAERERLISQILPIVDNLERALQIDEPKDLALWKGVLLVRKEIMRILSSEGVTRFESMGQPFDPQVHEAVGQRPASQPSGTIIQELESGYMLGTRLLRAARVIVAS